MQKYEKGTNRVGSSRLSDIARALGVPVSFFFDNGANDEASASEGGTNADPVAGFLNSEEGLALNIAFAQISDSAVRKKILSLVSALSNADELAQ